MQKTVIIIDDDQDWSASLATEVDKHPGFQVAARATCGRDGRLLIEHHRPDVVICDIIMPGDDGLRLIRQIGENKSHRPYLYVITAINTPSMQEMLRDLGVEFFDFKPVDAESIQKTLDVISQDKTRERKIAAAPQAAALDLADIIDEALLKIGMPSHLTGYLCVKTALYYVMENPNARKGVYDAICSALDVTKESVDKNMRTAIEACMQSDMYRKMYGTSKTSNLNFVYDLSLYVERRLREVR